MNENDFLRQQQAAVERMREMNSRATAGNTKQPMPPVPPFVKLQNGQQTGRQDNRRTVQNNRPQAQRENTERRPQNSPAAPPKPMKTEYGREQNGGFLSGLNIPFLDRLTNESDASLIVGLLLILISEKADKKLLFALIYILM